MKSNMKLLNNKYVLYFVSFIAFLNVLNYILNQKFSAILLFYVSGLLAFYFTKNMTIVLGVAILATFFAGFLNSFMGIKEGFKEGQSISSTPPKKQSTKQSTQTPSENMANKKSGYENLNKDKLNPGVLSTPNKEMLKKQLGDASKLENAYDNLEKVIGENGIKSMSGNTENLIKQQSELLKQLKEITPTLTSAIDSVNKLDFNKIIGSFKEISGSVNDSMTKM